MPELPDVEILRQYLESTSLHKTIVDVDVSEPALVEGMSVQEFRQPLIHERMTDTARHGKYLLVNLDGRLWMVMHFGMTGGLCYYRRGDPEPSRTRIRFSFENGYHLAYTSLRNLGKVLLITSPKDFISARQLGPDALSQHMDYSVFRQAMGRKKGMIKPALMDQSAVSGIGNLYSDEILFQSGVHPAEPIHSLGEDRLRKVYASMKKVLRTAVQHRADPSLMPAQYLLPVRTQGGRCPRCRSVLQARKISGRSAVFCPRCQPEPVKTSMTPERQPRRLT
ncbi:MAG TPA: DNA-formamidopyrimidine glycosylase family protein [Deltaproteobacteria bacterium]|jgi:formamidopyrimidine-DNA glycosylase|nr:DNA-formamidopyrimidine glycosylase family protein [Pseudomonadota bacterium]NLW66272.1 Fpg/Nei family DNA glycosylase [Bacteriovoracaceae bacterium]HOE72994.1 DNA-formamidopyrimidine glycosylase family protein [Deltaproteobacteria bacterium]HRR21760.1 DNA-formamidopyrimidine glycosylase family protein [Desulfomonilia bacterium]HOS27851.1 DNA-formamidopyrimidine glycosylase family protein [Deltaproteobacteria bacterium]